MHDDSMHNCGSRHTYLEPVFVISQAHVVAVDRHTEADADQRRIQQGHLHVRGGGGAGDRRGGVGWGRGTHGRATQQQQVVAVSNLKGAAVGGQQGRPSPLPFIPSSVQPLCPPNKNEKTDNTPLLTPHHDCPLLQSRVPGTRQPLLARQDVKHQLLHGLHTQNTARHSTTRHGTAQGSVDGAAVLPSGLCHITPHICCLFASALYPC